MTDSILETELTGAELGQVFEDCASNHSNAICISE